MDPKPQTRVEKEARGESGTLYRAVREIDWDGDVGGALRIWVYVDDFTPAMEYDSDLVYPPAHPAPSEPNLDCQDRPS